MRHFISIVLLLSTGLAFAQEGGGHDGNGGGGIYKNGRYMTFYSAGLYIDPLDLGLEEIPQLKALTDLLYEMPYLSNHTKAKYNKALMPSESRSYFRVKADTFTIEIRNRLIAEYARVMKTDPLKLTLFAITETTSGNTYLLPDFYKLNPVEQMAILFHEAYWMMMPNSSYTAIVKVESVFQGFLENQKSRDHLMRWLTLAAGKSDAVTASMKLDLDSGALNGLLSGKNKLKLPVLFGREYIDCVRVTKNSSECTSFIQVNVHKLIVRFPNSTFLKVFEQSLVTKRLKLTVRENDGGRENVDLINYNDQLDRDYIWDLSGLELDLSSQIYTQESQFDVGSGIHSVNVLAFHKNHYRLYL